MAQINEQEELKHQRMKKSRSAALKKKKKLSQFLVHQRDEREVVGSMERHINQKQVDAIEE